MKLALPLVCALSGSALAAPPSDEAMGSRVQQLLRAHQGEVFACVAAQRDAVAGEALLRVVVGRRGEAARVEVLKVEEGKAGARVAADCVAARARTWDYGALGAVEGDQVVFPLAFRPEPSHERLAVGARVDLVSLKANSTKRVPIEHVTALYVLGPGAPKLRSGAVSAQGAVGDVFLLQPGEPVELAATAASAVLRIEASDDVPEEGERFTHVRQADVAPIPLFGGRGEVRLLLDGTRAPFALDRLCAKKGASVPRHDHTSDELVYVVSGIAATTVEDRTLTQKAGDLVSIPRGTPHALRVDQDLCAAQVYAPRGPEQRFKRPTP